MLGSSVGRAQGSECREGGRHAQEGGAARWDGRSPAHAPCHRARPRPGRALLRPGHRGRHPPPLSGGRRTDPPPRRGRRLAGAGARHESRRRRQLRLLRPRRVATVVHRDDGVHRSHVLRTGPPATGPRAARPRCAHGGLVADGAERGRLLSEPAPRRRATASCSTPARTSSGSCVRTPRRRGRATSRPPPRPPTGSSRRPNRMGAGAGTTTSAFPTCTTARTAWAVLKLHAARAVARTARRWRGRTSTWPSPSNAQRVVRRTARSSRAATRSPTPSPTPSAGSGSRASCSTRTAIGTARGGRPRRWCPTSVPTGSSGPGRRRRRCGRVVLLPDRQLPAGDQLGQDGQGRPTARPAATPP